MKIFYATLSSNHSFRGLFGPGVVEIHAKDESTARQLIYKETHGKWAFMYKDLELVHPLDRGILGVLHEPS